MDVIVKVSLMIVIVAIVFTVITVAIESEDWTFSETSSGLNNFYEPKDKDLEESEDYDYSTILYRVCSLLFLLLGFFILAIIIYRRIRERIARINGNIAIFQPLLVNELGSFSSPEGTDEATLVDQQPNNAEANSELCNDMFNEDGEGREMESAAILEDCLDDFEGDQKPCSVNDSNLHFSPEIGNSANKDKTENYKVERVFGGEKLRRNPYSYSEASFNFTF